ncbi:MAG: sugar kinase [Proteobacteria bacterium]|nr:sugar kinase [Pseudomonadota bacterium]
MSAYPVIAFGEVLLRLKAPGSARLLQTPQLEASFGGAEFNVLASLARFGTDTQLVTVLPEGPLGTAALEEVLRFGVGTRYIRRQNERLGLYFLEAGADLRPGRIVYDRAGSAFAQLEREWFDWDVILAQARWLHITGITAALGAHPWASLVTATRTAKRLGVTVSLDVNTRPSLWAASQRSAREALRNVLGGATIIFAGLDDRHVCLGDAQATDIDPTDCPAFQRQVLEHYPQAEAIVSTIRRAAGATEHEISAVAQTRSEGTVTARTLKLRNVVDRVGAGDAFVAGYLHQKLNGAPTLAALDFGVAASALKHTIPGDVNRASLEEIEATLAGREGGRLVR